MTGGATGILYPRWRPLAGWSPVRCVRGLRHGRKHHAARGDGGTGGALGQCACRDMEVPARERRCRDCVRSGVARSSIMCSRAVREHYAESARGAYQAFFDSNIHADFVHIDDHAAVSARVSALSDSSEGSDREKLVEYVEQGGALVSEGLPGYFGEHGKVGYAQPNLRSRPALRRARKLRGVHARPAG